MLFDEIEKAHPDVFNMLLQILEDGILTDSQGRRVDFRNCIIIMTSNVGAKLIAKSGAGTLGFAPSSGETADDKKIREAVMGELKNVFRPEFLNRVDDIIVFRQLTQTDIDEIARRMLAGLSKRIAELDLKVEFAESAVSEIGKEGFDPYTGQGRSGAPSSSVSRISFPSRCLRADSAPIKICLRILGRRLCL